MVMASPSVRHRLSGRATTSASDQRDRRIPTQFTAMHPALNMFLVIRGENGSSQMCSQMELLGHDGWDLTLPLRAGRYRYRYYAIHEGVTTYVSPKDVEGKPVRMIGLDAILVVPDKRVSHPGTDESEERHDRPRH
jgi:hypothetical protein